jgi:D-alanine-D-alanine ligase
VLVEEFLPGREFTIGITGTGAKARVLGALEIVQKAGYVGHGYGYENKQSGWEDKLDIVRASDANARAAGRVALEAWHALNCRDGGRVDVREDANGRPCFIEVNPLAGLRPGYSDFCFIAEYEGLSYNDLIGLFLDSFLLRHPELKNR